MLNIASVNRPRSGRPCKTTAGDDSLLVRLTAPGGVDASDSCFVKNCTSDSCSQWSQLSYCCPETSTKQEAAKKPCCVRQGPQPDGRFDIRKCDFSDESSVELHPYFIYFLRKIKCIDYNLIDYYLRQVFCPGRNRLVHHYQAINLISIYEIFVLIVSK